MPLIRREDGHGILRVISAAVSSAQRQMVWRVLVTKARNLIQASLVAWGM